MPGDQRFPYCGPSSTPAPFIPININVVINWQKKEYGFHFTFSSPITSGEADRWRAEIKQAVSQLREDYHVFVDLRNCELIPFECKTIIEDAQTFCKENGMWRSVLILSDEVTAMQLKILAKKTGIYEWERYVVSSLNPDWEQLGMNWILHAIDPDAAHAPGPVPSKPGH